MKSIEQDAYKYTHTHTYAHTRQLDKRKLKKHLILRWRSFTDSQGDRTFKEWPETTFTFIYLGILKILMLIFRVVFSCMQKIDFTFLDIVYVELVELIVPFALSRLNYQPFSRICVLLLQTVYGLLTCRYVFNWILTIIIVPLILLLPIIISSSNAY